MPKESCKKKIKREKTIKMKLQEIKDLKELVDYAKKHNHKGALKLFSNLAKRLLGEAKNNKCPIFEDCGCGYNEFDEPILCPDCQEVKKILEEIAK